MKLLFDQNVSPKLVGRLANVFPGSVHVSEVDLERAFDRELWTYAAQNDLTIVTKDADFGELSVVEGFPPNVIWIRRGNCSTAEIEALLRENEQAVNHLSDDAETGVLELY